MRVSTIEDNKATIAEDKPFYYLQIYNTNRDMSPADTDAVRNKLRRMTKDNPNFAWFIAESTTEMHGKELVKHEYVDTGGRKKRVVKGEKIPRHIHLGLMRLDNHKGSYEAKELCEFLKKKRNISSRYFPSRQYDPASNNTTHRYIQYCHNQADRWFTSSNADFDSIIN